jgi:hypothetical protein
MSEAAVDTTGTAREDAGLERLGYMPQLNLTSRAR